MTDEKEFRCKKCGKRERSATAPECCGNVMEEIPLEVCTTAPSAEHARPMSEEKPCDDSRGG